MLLQSASDYRELQPAVARGSPEPASCKVKASVSQNHDVLMKTQNWNFDPAKSTAPNLLWVR